MGLATSGTSDNELEVDSVLGPMLDKDDLMGNRNFESAALFCDELDDVERLHAGGFAMSLGACPLVALLCSPPA